MSNYLGRGAAIATWIVESKNEISIDQRLEAIIDRSTLRLPEVKNAANQLVYLVKYLLARTLPSPSRTASTQMTVFQHKVLGENSKITHEIDGSDCLRNLSRCAKTSGWNMRRRRYL